MSNAFEQVVATIEEVAGDPDSMSLEDYRQLLRDIIEECEGRLAADD